MAKPSLNKTIRKKRNYFKQLGHIYSIFNGKFHTSEKALLAFSYRGADDVFIQHIFVRATAVRD